MSFRVYCRGICLFAGVAVALNACDDTTAGEQEFEAQLLTMEAGDVSDAGDACTVCLTDQIIGGAEACAEDSIPCMAQEACSTLLLCDMERGCLDLTQAETLACGTPCSALAGVNGPAHPALVHGFPLFFCARAACAVECGIDLSDGGM